MRERDWKSLFLVALSHGQQLERHRLSSFWFTKFIHSIGFTPIMAHMTGVSPLFLELIWRRRSVLGSESSLVLFSETEADIRGSAVTSAASSPRGNRNERGDEVGKLSPSVETCTYDEFVAMMTQVSVRAYQVQRAQETLQRFNEKEAITTTARDQVSVKEALHHTGRKYFAKAFERSFVTRDSVISLDPEKSTLTPVAKQVVLHALSCAMDLAILPYFGEFGSSGVMNVEQFLRFAAAVLPTYVRVGPDASCVRAVFCQANSLDTVGLVHKSEEQRPELEADEFLEALLLLAVLMFADERRHPLQRTIESKVWSFLEHLVTLRSGVMPASAECEAELCTLRPRLALVFPRKLPLYAFSGFVVGGINVVMTPNVEEVDGDTAALSLRLSLPSPRADLVTSRTRTNHVSDIAYKLLSQNFSTAVKLLAPQKKPMSSSTRTPPRMFSSLTSSSAPLLPASGNNNGEGDEVASLSISVNELSDRDESAVPAHAKDTNLCSKRSLLSEMSQAVVLPHLLWFEVEGHVIPNPIQLAPNRVQLSLPRSCIGSKGYRCFAVCRSEATEAGEVIQISVHQERVAHVSMFDAVSKELLNSMPIVLQLRPMQSTTTVALTAALRAHFDQFAPTGRMDFSQFRDAVAAGKNVPKTASRESCFSLFASTSNASVETVELSTLDTLVVSFARDAFPLPGSAALSFDGFLHAFAMLYLDGVFAGDKKIPPITDCFEMALDVAKHGADREEESGTSAAGAKRKRVARPPIEKLVPRIPELTGVTDSRLDVPFQRAFQQRTHHRMENKALEDELRREFQKEYAGVAPAPVFPKVAVEDTPLSLALRDGVPRRLFSSNDASLSFDTRSQSMKMDYFVAAMVRTLGK